MTSSASRRGIRHRTASSTKLNNKSKNSTTRDIMKKAWFKHIGRFHLPASIPGAIISLLALAFCVQVFMAVDRHSHSASDTLYGIFPYFVCCFLVVDWIAARTNGESN